MTKFKSACKGKPATHSSKVPQNRKGRDLPSQFSEDCYTDTKLDITPQTLNCQGDTYAERATLYLKLFFRDNSDKNNNNYAKTLV